MKSAERIEQSVRRLSIQADAENREHTLRDLVETHAQQKRKTQAFSLLRYGRIIMKQKQKRIAAVVAVGVLLIGVFSLSTGSVAFSQAKHAASSTLSWLKSMLAGNTPEEPAALPPGPIKTSEQTAGEDRRAIWCAAYFFDVPESQQGLWQSLKDQGIEFVEASGAPPVQYAVLSREQAESFSTGATLRCISAPRVTVLEGETAGIALTNDQRSGGLALGWLPTISSNGEEVVSTLSFHDGQNGFEIPDVSTEPGGMVLIRARGMFPDAKDGLGQSRGDTGEVLVQIQVEIQ
ncbi:MAG: hypothetical protein ABFE13_07365 [Phycisphaerales bacterium]